MTVKYSLKVAGIAKSEKSGNQLLRGSSEIDFSSEPTVAGTMVFGEVDSDLYDPETENTTASLRSTCEVERLEEKD